MAMFWPLTGFATFNLIKILKKTFCLKWDLLRLGLKFSELKSIKILSYCLCSQIFFEKKIDWPKLILKKGENGNFCEKTVFTKQPVKFT